MFVSIRTEGTVTSPGVLDTASDNQSPAVDHFTHTTRRLETPIV